MAIQPTPREFKSSSAYISLKNRWRETGINLFEAVEHCDAANPPTDPAIWAETSATINSVIEDASNSGIGLINCGGSNHLYIIGGDQFIYGTAAIQPAGQPLTTMPFKRGILTMKDNVEMRGNSRMSRPKFLAAPELNPGPMWRDRWVEGIDTVNFSLRNLDLDANEENYTVSAYETGQDDGPMWIQGHCVAAGHLRNFLVEGCVIHGWWGHGLFGGSNTSVSTLNGNWKILDSEFYNNMQGGMQVAVKGLISQRNYFHGNGGWTAVGENFELGEEGLYMEDCFLIDNIYDMRDGLSTTIATAKYFNTQSQAALDARRHFRRAIWLSGNYYTAPPVFGRKRGRIHIIRPHVYQGIIGGGGFDDVSIDSPMIENYHEDGIIQFPVASQAINFSTTSYPTPENLQKISITDAKIYHNQPLAAAIQVENFQDAQITGSITGPDGPCIRLNNCGGKVDITAINYGSVNDNHDFWSSVGQPDDQIGALSAGVTAFGHKGPLDITVRAIETRDGTNRLAQVLAYINTGPTHVTTVRGSGTNLLKIANKMIKVPYGAVIDDGIFAPDSLTRKITYGAEVQGILTVPGLHVQNDTDDALITFLSPNGTKQGLVMTTQTGLEGTLYFSANGDIGFQTFDAGTFRGQIQLVNDGHLFIGADWHSPIQLGNGKYLWVETSTQFLRVKGGAPTSDDDGIIVGMQTDGSDATPPATP